ncbi:ATP-binding protein [Halosolutus amylolyticus]|uniref:histidine kinase n=1 Tax=Halosolutus amylolyticus TaxID=2932267 RepID=A0ABD5PW03_9EURY|nr:hybrid sensor histidine kinase/response regulator [Halosolutus amylolyticus]
MSTTRSLEVDVLLVEDDADDARYVERLVHGHRTRRDERGVDAPIAIAELDHVDRLADAEERVRTRPPDVVLLDLMLPDSRGVSTVESMVEAAPELPIVVLTGRDDAEVGVEAIQRGAEEYLVKESITAEAILRTLRYAIERTRRRSELRDRNQRLALLNRLLRKDIRNDVSMIVGLTDQIRREREHGDEATIETVLEAAGHVAKLTDTAAELTSVISEDDVRHAPCNLIDVVEGSVANVRREYDASMRIERPESGAPILVSGSPMLGSAFVHLLQNAVEHSDRSVPRVTVTVETSADRATVSIADDGVGIPDTQKDLLTDPSVRFDEASGMGVGLYLVTTVLEELGGEFEIEDNEAGGTTVTVTLDRVHSR